MWPDQVSNAGPLALESDVLPTGLHSPIRQNCSNDRSNLTLKYGNSSPNYSSLPFLTGELKVFFCLHPFQEYFTYIEPISRKR